MKAVTIDKLDMKDHVRWAQDQAHLDPTYSQKSPLIEHHPEVLWTTVIYSSRWEELFQMQIGTLPWAAFAPPKQYHLVAKRLFSYRLFPHIHWKEEEGSDEGKEEEEGETPDLFKQVIGCKKLGNQSHSLFEKDKTAILNLLELIKYLNTLLGQINARKLQYQKG